MPIYEFKCKKCTKESEVLVYNKSDHICPHCGSRKLERLMSAFAVSGTTKKVRSGGGNCSSCHSGNCSTCG